LRLLSWTVKTVWRSCLSTAYFMGLMLELQRKYKHA